VNYIAVVDQSTSSSKAFLVDARGDIVRRAAKPHKQFYPAPGRVEHDAEEIFQNVKAVLCDVLDGINLHRVRALSIANQRETTVVWDRKTGVPVAPAMVWQDIRGKSIVDALSNHAELARQITGAAISPYLPGSKIAALRRENPEIAARMDAGALCVGTIDSYLVYRLTDGEVFASDYTNASRTQLFNLNTLDWDARMLSLFDLKRCFFADRLLPADADFGSYLGIPITGVLGDSHAALFGHGCHAPETVKATYGTGSSVMWNVGSKPLIAQGGLTAAVGLAFQGCIAYEIEGNITSSGDTLVWLSRDLGMFRDAAEIEACARAVSDAGGVYLVPALSGLGAPHFDLSAKAIICGMTRGTTRAHIARAALDSIVLQGADVIAAMEQMSGKRIKALMADGGAAKNALLMQAQADYAGCEVKCPSEVEISALGAAYIGGIATGVYRSFEDIPARNRDVTVYNPRMDPQKRATILAGWREAVQKARETP
jgi:glycerol kinase